MPVIHKMPPFENVGAGQTAIIPRLPMGMTFHNLVLKLGGTFTKAQIDNIRVKLGGKTIWDITGSALDSVNQYMGLTANAAYLPLHFAEPNARTIVGEMVGALDSSLGYSGFSIEVDINAAAVNPTLDSWAVLSPPKAGEAKAIFRSMIKATHNKGASGAYNFPIPLGSARGALLKRLHLFHTNVDEIIVKRNGLDLQDQGENAMIQFLQNELTRVTQAGMIVYDPTFRDNQSEAVPTVNPDGNPSNFEFRVNLTAADTVTSYSEMYASLDRI